MATLPSYKYEREYLSAVLHQRLEQLQCSQLPPSIKGTLVERFVAEAHARIDRLAQRSITIPSIAKTFTESAKEGRACHVPNDERTEKGAHTVGVQGEDFSLPPDELGIPTGAFGERSQSP